jgi:hypothetical protein
MDVHGDPQDFDRNVSSLITDRKIKPWDTRKKLSRQNQYTTEGKMPCIVA